MNSYKFSIGKIAFHGQSCANEMRRQSRPTGALFCRFNPTDGESIVRAAAYVGATKSELAGIKERYHKACLFV